MQVTAAVLALAATVVGVALFARTVGTIASRIRLGQPDPGRTNSPTTRTVTLFREFLGHTRMARLPVVAAAHWFVMVSFGVLFFSLVTAYGQVFNPHFALSVIGHFFLYEWAVEAIGWLSLAGILALIVIRQKTPPRRPSHDGRRSRFFGSTWWQAYYVELTILGVVLCVLSLRFLEYWLGSTTGADWATKLHFPTTWWLGTGDGLTQHQIENAIVVVATLKILVSMAWFITVGLQPTMGIAWHRFLAFFNIWFKRPADGRTSLGAVQPIAVAGQPVDFENIDELDEDPALGVGKVEDFTWKGLLDFNTCTECGRCQSQCPAWNTDKPLSPKLLVMALREHAYAKAPYLLAGGGKNLAGEEQATPEQLGSVPAAALAEAARPLVGTVPDGGVIDP